MIPEPMYSSEPSNTIKTPNSNSNGHKAKSHLSEHKHHTTKHHKTGKKALNIKVNKKIVGGLGRFVSTVCPNTVTSKYI